MKYKKITNHNEYFLLVDEEAEIKEDDCAVDDVGTIYKNVGGSEQDMRELNDNSLVWKIIAHLPKNAPKLEGVDLLSELRKKCEYCGGDGVYIDGDNNRLKCPACIDGNELSSEEDVEQLTKLDLLHLVSILRKSENYKSVMDITLEATLLRLLKQYEAAKQSEKKYSDLINERIAELHKDYNARAFHQGDISNNRSRFDELQKLKDKIQSLSTTTPIDFEVEMEKSLSEKDIMDAEIGDYVENTHGSGGIINDLSDDVRVSIGDFIEVAQTSDNGHETLNICGYKIYNIDKPKVINGVVQVKWIY